MKLPKIRREDLPEEVRNLIGDGEYEFESIVDPADVIDVPLDMDKHHEDRLKTAQQLLKVRKELDEYNLKNFRKKSI